MFDVTNPASLLKFYMLLPRVCLLSVIYDSDNGLSVHTLSTVITYTTVRSEIPQFISTKAVRPECDDKSCSLTSHRGLNLLLLSGRRVGH